MPLDLSLTWGNFAAVRILILLLGLMLTVTWPAYSSADPSSNASNSDNFSRPYLLQLKWFHSFQFAGYYAAAEKGYYTDEGLKVIIRERQTDSTPVEDVLRGHADFGVGESGITLDRLNNKPVVILGVIFQRSPLVLISLAEKNYTNPLDLSGKRVMYQRNGDNISIESTFYELGMDPKEYTWVDHNFNDLALLEDNVDAMSAYLSDQPFLYRELGHRINIIDPASYGIDFYGDNFFTTESLLLTQPKVVSAFRRATLKGWEYALKHPDEVYEWLNSKYVNYRAAKPNKKKFMEEVKVIKRMIKPASIPLGDVNVNRFNRIAYIYKERGLAAPEAELDSGFYFASYKLDEMIDYKNWLRLIALGGVAFVTMAVLLLMINRSLKLKVEERTAELRKANDAKSEFLASMSHELRTPLNSIIGYTERLLRKYGNDFDERALDSLETVKRNGHHLLSLINDILDLSKIDSGKFEINMESCLLAPIIDDVIKTLENQINDKQLRVNAPGHYPVQFLDADPMRLTQVILNLLSNAIKYTPKQGNIHILIFQKKIRGISYCRIDIKDDGIGISEDDQRNLFKRFEQFHQHSDSKIGSGTGLGLALCHEIVRLHGGYISCHSELDKGSTFSVHIPLERPPTAQEQTL